MSSLLTLLYQQTRGGRVVAAFMTTVPEVSVDCFDVNVNIAACVFF